MKLASIEKIIEVTAHPNADRLDIVKVLGYNCIVPKDKFKVDDLIVLIQPDTVLPKDQQWAEPYIKFAPKRVKAAKIRGSWSFGIVIALDELNIDQSMLEGDEVSDVIGITKYTAPEPKSLDAKGGLPYGICKTDEDRYQNIRDLPLGSLVDITLKIDGKSATYYCKKNPDGSYSKGICTRSLEIKPETNNDYTFIEKKYNILASLEKWCIDNDHSGIAIRGEIYGGKIQGFDKNPHRGGEIDFAAYSTWDIDNRHYYTNPFDKTYYFNVAAAIGVKAVPNIEASESLTTELIEKYRDADCIEYYNGSEMVRSEYFEGVVFKVLQVNDPVNDLTSFKVINLKYDSIK